MCLGCHSDAAVSRGNPRPFLRRIAAAGFTHVHWCHHWDSDFVYADAEVDAIGRWLRAYGLRLLDLDKRLWSDHWVNAKSGVLGAAGLTGSFEDGEGVFEARDSEDGKAVIYRGVWDRIVRGKSHRWYQAASRDDGRTWDYTWFMDWTRA